MKKNILFILLIIFASCKSASISQNIQGEYYKRGKDYQYNLTLNNDSSFILTQKYFDVTSKCQGRWQYLSKDTLLLKCDDEVPPAVLAGGYMSEREKKVVVLSQNKLKIKQVILRRVRQ